MYKKNKPIRTCMDAAHPGFELILCADLTGLCSGQAPSRHVCISVCRCFLPNLTGFAEADCTKPNHQYKVFRRS